MKPDIDRMDMDGIVTFCAFSIRGRNWMKAEYPTKYNALNHIIFFRVPPQDSDMEDFVDRAVAHGLAIRLLCE